VLVACIALGLVVLNYAVAQAVFPFGVPWVVYVIAFARILVPFSVTFVIGAYLKRLRVRRDREEL